MELQVDGKQMCRKKSGHKWDSCLPSGHMPIPTLRFQLSPHCSTNDTSTFLLDFQSIALSFHTPATRFQQSNRRRLHFATPSKPRSCDYATSLPDPSLETTRILISGRNYIAGRTGAIVRKEPQRQNMLLTKQRTTPRDPNKFPTSQLFFLGELHRSKVATAVSPTYVLTNDPSTRESRRTNRAYLDLSICLAPRARFPCRRAKQCLLLCGTAHIGFRIGGVDNRNARHCTPGSCDKQTLTSCTGTGEVSRTGWGVSPC